MTKNNDIRFCIREGLVYNNKLFMSDDTNTPQSLLQEYHSMTLGGHLGVAATIHRPASTFQWPKLMTDVCSFVRDCKTCQETKYPTHNPYGLLQPLPIPTQVWNEILRDFITDLPPSGSKTVIWVVLDRFSKFAHFLSLPSKFTTSAFTDLFLQTIYRLNDLPQSIITDRDPLFLSGF